jgi:hypothetical protein
LFDEDAVLKKARNEIPEHRHQRLLFEDFERTWRLRQQVARDSYQQLVELDKTMRTRTGQDGGALLGRGTPKPAQPRKVRNPSRNRLALWVGARRDAILDTIEQRVAARIESLDQWSADIDAMRS